MFRYTSVQSHGIITPKGEKIKETRVNVENGQGTKTVTVTDDKGSHSDTSKLTKSEITNIQKHRFMPNFFKKTLTNVKRLKNRTLKRSSKKGKSKK